MSRWAATARCPVVVVPPGVQRIATTGPIVCGVDGSDVSNTAARVAADFADRLETRLLLVHAGDSLPAAVPGVAGGHGAASGRRPDAAALILRETADMLRETPPSYLLVERGAPAERLAAVAERESAQLLIIGSRERGPITSALLGSVASQLATSATRPLMIVPPNAPRPRASFPVLATRRLRSGAAVLCVRGALDSRTAREFEQQAARLLAETRGRLVVDLSEATSIDGDTARVTGRLAHQASELGGRVALVATDPAVRSELDRAADPWALTTDALDVALEAVSDRFGLHSAGV
jgi:anti-anti-sigma factor